MPRKRKQVSYKDHSENEEESEWEDDEKASDDELEYEDDEVVEKKKPPPKRKKQEKAADPTRKSPAKKLAAAKREEPSSRPDVEYDISSEEEDFVPSQLRKTDYGGYSHTQRTRLKISKANRGNVPWNKGKNRSATDRVKIAAGVRARVRAQLLKKLQRLGMTEDEYNEKAKEVKSLREKLRRARFNTQKHKEKLAAEANRCTKELADARLERSTEATSEAQGSGEKSVNRQGSSALRLRQRDNRAEGSTNDKADGSDDEVHAAAKRVVIPAQPTSTSDKDELLHPMFAMFAPEIHWSPHPFDDEKVSYRNTCPNGGPGGFICCSICAATYSKYLSSTHKDFEQQSSSKVARELEQMVGFMTDAKQRLGKAVRAAKRKPPPG